MLGRLLDVKVWRGEGGGMSDHFFGGSSAEIGGWLEGVRNVSKVSEQNNSVKKGTPGEFAWKIRSVERWGGLEGVGKVKRYSNGVYQ